jgi:hypothetical protein
VKSKQLKREPRNDFEIDGLFRTGRVRLKDASNLTLSQESRFDLAYNAAHALSLVALRWHGYRPDHRYIVFQTIPHTLELGSEVWRVLSKCHDIRNACEYEGFLEFDDQLLRSLGFCPELPGRDF